MERNIKNLKKMIKKTKKLKATKKDSNMDREELYLFLLNIFNTKAP